MGVTFTLGIVFNNYILPIFVMVIGISLVFIAKSRVKDIIEDERHYKIGGYAGKYAITLFSIIASISGLILIVQKSPILEAVAYTLFCSISVLLFCYLILYAYFEKKM
jgi:uncharacterized membrane protein